MKKEISWLEYDAIVSDLAMDIASGLDLNNSLIIGMSRGGLPLATHLSHLLELPMSIINYRRIDGINETEPELFHNHDEDIKTYKTILLVDDIHDSGDSMNICLEFMKKHNPNGKIVSVVLVENTHYDGVKKTSFADFCGELNDTSNSHPWVYFPWEQ